VRAACGPRVLRHFFDFPFPAGQAGSVSGACYLVALSIDLYYIIRDKKNLGKVLLDFIRIACISAAAVGAAFPLRHMGALPILGVCAGVYLALKRYNPRETPTKNHAPDEIAAPRMEIFS